MSFRLLRFCWVVVAALSFAGCAGDATSSRGASSAAPGASVAEPAGGEASGSKSSAILAVTSAPRKIIYTAQVELAVEDLIGTGKKLLALVQRHGGYVASTDVAGNPGTPRRGEWKLRVPVQAFEAFRAELEDLGAVQSSHLDSQDVTAEYYDVEAHIKNKQVEEQRLQEHLRRSTGTLADILTVERELSRVRGEIEQLQGRLRLLANQSALTTITVTLQEVREFVPGTGASFLAEAGATFQTSVGLIRDLAKGAALTIVALAPWAILLALVGGPVWVVARRRAGFRW